jgi:hypothetical protein
MGPMPSPTSNFPLGVLIDCDFAFMEKQANRTISTDIRTKGTLVLIGFRLLVSLLLDFRYKIEKEKNSERMNDCFFLKVATTKALLLGISTK